MNPELKEKLALLESLSKFYLDSNLPLEALDKNEFLVNLAYLVKAFSLSNLPVSLKLFHQLFSHQDSYLKLDCKSLHCIECYSYFMDTFFFTDAKQVSSCTCGHKISPLFRKKILDNFERIMNLRRFCLICSRQKDLMEFLVLNTHPCVVCTSCIVGRFEFADPASPCLACGQVYDEESLLSIRSFMAESQPAELVFQVFSKTCKKCGSGRDQRFFTKICENDHESCKECVKKMLTEQVKNCFECNHEISILQDVTHNLKIK